MGGEPCDPRCMMFTSFVTAGIGGIFLLLGTISVPLGAMKLAEADSANPDQDFRRKLPDRRSPALLVHRPPY